MPSEDRPSGKPEGYQDKRLVGKGETETHGWKPPKATNPSRPIKPPSGSGGTPKGK